MPETYTFNGFTPATGEFFWELAFNNERIWFNEHKTQFEELLNKPMKALARETTELLQNDFPLADLECHVSRIYRDARRLHGRGPYKENLWFSIKNRSNGYNGPSFFFEITPKDWCYGMGFYCARSDEMEAFRKSIDANPSRFQRLAEEVDAMPEMVIEGEYYKRPKADYGETINQWYNRKWSNVICNQDFGGDLFNPELPQILAAAFCKLMPMYEYLNTFTRTYL